MSGKSIGLAIAGVFAATLLAAPAISHAAGMDMPAMGMPYVGFGGSMPAVGMPYVGFGGSMPAVGMPYVGFGGSMPAVGMPYVGFGGSMPAVGMPYVGFGGSMPDFGRPFRGTLGSNLGWGAPGGAMVVWIPAVVGGPAGMPGMPPMGTPGAAQPVMCALDATNPAATVPAGQKIVVIADTETACHAINGTIANPAGATAP